ncbi:Glycosyltransferase involved in cell wall bisynthesis [Filimonas lacunae]|uniref:Glycosyltransferase involved in cell wall bisynthesis n=1 Tax=Filimonas lacunae TaxID=477680 RepID=A0A173MQQ4_9BACT|nr:glycosyltransferase family 2 protein [Filimonas lacunae]BAV09826.1 alpha-L-Rha alpha-1,3-L-rhamnosyltransferase [Filimonas lacunae]SIS79533.1 Glycosyltransferase involved in cell wall bisynthesis [Filimonas lacunae]
MQPLVSIIVCTYNGADFVAAQIQSLLQQTYAPLEIIIADDASTDNTRAILNTFAGDSRVQLIYNDTNKGYTKNFEQAALQAKGDYLAFCDQDDIWLPEKVEKLVQQIVQTGVLLSYSDSLLVNEQAQSMNKQLSHMYRMYSGSDTRGFVFSNVVWGHAMLVNKQLLQKAFPIPTPIPHDIWLAVVAAANSGIAYVNEPLTLYRQHSKTVTQTIMPKNVASRKADKRFRDFQKQLNWMKAIAAVEQTRNTYTDFYSNLVSLFAKKAEGRFVWPLFRFLLKHQHALFQFTNKSGLSRFVEIRKLSRGEKGSA